MLGGAIISASAQVENANRLILHSTSGETTVLNLSELEYMDFGRVDNVSVQLQVKPGTLTQSAFTVVMTPSAECASYTISFAPTGAPLQQKGTYTSGAELDFADLLPGTPYTISATPKDIYGIACDATTLEVMTEASADLPAPKVGDYYYSDGTWSDGGLLSIGDDGRNAVWKSDKPAPLTGKTVIGVVFQTNPDRMAESDIEAGFNHGYVIGLRNIVDPNKRNYAQWPETAWYGGIWGMEIETIQVSKSMKSCYTNLMGREETQALKEAYSEDLANSLPLFYYGTDAYPVAAPEGTSGWFIPSVGQMWDCVANFVSGEVANYLATIHNSTSDFTYYCSVTTSIDNVFGEFMKPFALIPAEFKDEMTKADSTNTMSLATSSRYDTESRVIISLGMQNAGYMHGVMEGMAEWFDGEVHGRPILAF